MKETVALTAKAQVEGSGVILDRELVRDGREAVGLSVGIPKRQTNKPQGPKDDLD